MIHSKIIKVITLTGFITLVCAFLLYRGGYFDSLIYQGSKKENSLLSIKRDTSHSARLSSSKSIVLTDIKISANDTNKNKTDTLKLTTEQLRILSSSKSGSIIEPKSFIPDSLYKQHELEKTKKN